VVERIDVLNCAYSDHLPIAMEVVLPVTLPRYDDRSGPVVLPLAGAAA